MEKSTSIMELPNEIIQSLILNFMDFETARSFGMSCKRIEEVYENTYLGFPKKIGRLLNEEMKMMNRQGATIEAVLSMMKKVKNVTKHFSNEVELEVDTRRVKENIKEWIESSQMEIESKKELKELLVKLKFVSKLDQGGSKEVNFDVVYTFGDVKLSLHCEENQKRGVNYEIRNQSDRIVLCKALFNETMRWRAPECLPFLMKELNLTVTTHKNFARFLNQCCPLSNAKWLMNDVILWYG